MVKVERFTDYSRGMRLGRKMYRATLGEMSADGTTPVRARESLLAAVETAISGNEWLPFTVVYGENYATVYRDLQGWGYVFGPSHNLKTEGRCRSTVAVISEPGSTRLQVIFKAKVHLAQAAYPLTNGLDLLTASPAVTSEGVRYHLRWLCFQRAYFHARDVLKLPDAGRGDCHEFACNESGNPVWLADEEERAAWEALDSAR